MCVCVCCILCTTIGTCDQSKACQQQLLQGAIRSFSWFTSNKCPGLLYEEIQYKSTSLGLLRMYQQTVNQLICSCSTFAQKYCLFYIYPPSHHVLQNSSQQSSTGSACRRMFQYPFMQPKSSCTCRQIYYSYNRSIVIIQQNASTMQLQNNQA